LHLHVIDVNKAYKLNPLALEFTVPNSPAIRQAQAAPSSAHASNFDIAQVIN